MASSRSRDLARLRQAAAQYTEEQSEVPTARIPDGGIAEFATSKDFLGLSLFPLQLLILKIATLSVELFTSFDRMIIQRWGEGFILNEDLEHPAFEGRKGTTPDLLERIETCRNAGRTSCEELVLVLGRRGSKSFLAAILVAWRLWNLLALEDPQRHYKIPSDKVLAVHLFAADQTTLVRNGYGDVVNLLRAPCFHPFLGKQDKTMTSLLTPAQLSRGARAGRDVGNIQVVAAATTSTAIRGAAVPMAWMDEFGHVNGAGSTSDSVEIYTATDPALAQFRDNSLVIQTSTPLEKLGQFYASYLKALRVDPITGDALAPGVFMFQLPSDELYLYAEEASGLEMWPGGPNFPPGLEPKITRSYIEERRLWDPRGVEVEYEAQFASAVNAYLLPDKISEGFGLYKGRRLTHLTVGKPGITYVAHVDPGKTEANYAVSIGHLVWEQGRPNVIGDRIQVWKPSDFPGGTVNYLEVERELLELIKAFRISTMVFDQFNSIGTIQKLQAQALDMGLDWRPHIYERPATADLNWTSAEVFKKALHLGLFHAPPHELAQAELEHLVVVGEKVSAPTSGDVQTDDVADCLIGMTYTLLREHLDVFQKLGQLQPSGSLQGGLPLQSSAPGDPIAQQFRDFGDALLARRHGRYHNSARRIRRPR